jgi:methionine-rich copper-binding protein CopC
MSRQRKLIHMLVLGTALLATSATETLAHARYDRSEPPAGSTLDGTPFVLKAWFTQELMSRSSIVVHDAAGTQVDLGDGRVDLDDPDRKVMLVSLPQLSPGSYQVTWTTLSAEDGDEDTGTFAFDVAATASAASVTSPTMASKGACTSDQ